MHYTALERYHESLVTEGDWSYVEPKDMDAKIVRVVWPWLRTAATALPENRGLMVKVPAGENTQAFSNRVRSILSIIKPTSDWKWSVRTSKDDKALFVLKGDMWPEAEARLRREAGLTAIEEAQTA